MHVTVSYDYTSCVTNVRNGCNTLHTTMNVYEPEGNGPDDIRRSNPASYSREVQMLEVPGGRRGVTERVFQFLPSPNAAGFYLGIHDTGTCGTINRITIHYQIVPSRTEGLITYPEIPLPPLMSTERVTRNITCARDSTAFNPTLSIDSRGIVEGNPICLCSPGYQFESLAGIGAECTGMNIFTFESADFDSMQQLITY